MMSKKETPHAISAQDVLSYLQDNPTFLNDYPDAMDLLCPPKGTNGKTVADFQSYMIERLKADKAHVIDETKTLVENSRANMNNQQRVHTAVLHILESQNFEDFIQCITMDMASILDVDISVMVIESDQIGHIRTPGVRLVPAGTIDKWMTGHNVLLQDDISGIEAIYGGGATLVRSQILLRVDISMDTPPALIAFGSRNPNMFHAGQATDQIQFLARVIERCFRGWLNMPKA